MEGCKSCKLIEEYFAKIDPEGAFYTSASFVVGLFPKHSYFLRSFISPIRHLGFTCAERGFYSSLVPSERDDLAYVQDKVTHAVMKVGKDYGIVGSPHVLTKMSKDLEQHPNLDLIPNYDRPEISFDGVSFVGQPAENVIIESFHNSPLIEQRVKHKLNEMMQEAMLLFF